MRFRTALGGAALSMSLLAAGCGSAGDAPLEASAGAAPTAAPDPSVAVAVEQTTTSTAPPTWPLLGVLSPDPAAVSAQPVVVKVDNSPQARPHAGVNEADVVYELQVEGITRFMEVFHSTLPERVGPVRSARQSDLDLIAGLGTPILAWSGGNPGVTELVDEANASGLLVDVGHPTSEGDYYRDSAGGRVAPHNLYTNLAAMRNAHPAEGDHTPTPLFAYDAAATPGSTALPTPGLVIDFGLGVRVEWVWRDDLGCWARFQVDERHSRADSTFVDEAGTQVCPPNLVVLFLPYERSTVDARSPMAISVGEGDGLVLTGGTTTPVRWSRPAAGAGWALTDLAGTPVALPPGRSWVALPDKDADSAQPLDAGTADGLLALVR